MPLANRCWLEPTQKIHTKSLHSTAVFEFLRRGGMSRSAAIHHSAMPSIKIVTKQKLFHVFFSFPSPFWPVGEQLEWITLRPALKKERVFPPSGIYLCALTQAGSSQLKAKEMLSVARRCFFHEVITSPWVEELLATKGLLFGLAQYAAAPTPQFGHTCK